MRIIITLINIQEHHYSINTKTSITLSSTCDTKYFVSKFDPSNDVDLRYPVMDDFVPNQIKVVLELSLLTSGVTCEHMCGSHF